MTARPVHRAGVVAGSLTLVGFLAVAAAAPALTATSDTPQTTVRKSVQTLMNSRGEVQATRVYSQIQSQGTGNVTFSDPVSGSLRNLNGFGSPATVSDGVADFNFETNGLKNQRTLQDFQAGKLPITITASATLDGQPIDPADLVGKSGLLKMTYVVDNVTGEEQEITWTDGAGVTQRKTVSVPLPYVGTMSTVLSDTFSQISAPGASAGGTGRNSTQLSYTLILFEPLGAAKQTLSYEARITNADVPQVDLTFLPTAPADNPSTKSAQDQYKGGQETGAKLTAGATTIDTNLLKLAAGAGTLNAGLAQLQAGADQLAAGLNGTAVPGANKLAAGATDLATGLNDTAVPGSKQLAAGADELSSGLSGKLSPGATKLSDGNSDLSAALTDQILPGANSLSAGVVQIRDGLAQLNSATTGIPAAKAGAQQLLAGVDQILAGLGTPSDAPGQSTIFGAFKAVAAGLPSLKTGLGQAKGGVDQVKTGLDAATDGSSTSIQALSGAVAAAQATAGCAGDPVCTGNLAAASGGLATLVTQTQTAAAGLGQVSTGLGQAIGSIGAANTPGNTLAYGQAQGLAGLSQVYAGLTNANPPGVKQGLTSLVAGLTAATTGVAQLYAGSVAAASGSQQLAGGLTTASAGADTLAEGASQLAAGVDTAAIGSSKIAVGAGDLSDGLVTAADGSTQIADGANQIAVGIAPAAAGATKIADGLGQAVPGGTKIEDGANQLSEEGTKALIVAGQGTTNSFGEKYSYMQALNTRAATGAGIPNGPATGSDVVTSGAFGYTLEGVTQEGSTNGLRFLLAGLLLAAGVGVGVAFGRS